MTNGPVRITSGMLDVVQALLDEPEMHGWGIVKYTQRRGPTVYAILDRLTRWGWVASRWEDAHPEPGTPRRRFYRLTPLGVDEAKALLAERRP